MTVLSKPSVFEFSKYDDYLKAYVAYRKSVRKNWSVAMWAKRLGLAGTASLSMVINGQRKPGEKLLNKLCQYFEFNDSEYAYFTTLVSITKNTKNKHIVLGLEANLAKMSTKRRDKTYVNSDAFRLMSQWYYYAIRELVHVKGFLMDPLWISKQFRVGLTTRQIRDALQTLLRLKFLSVDANGTVQQSQGILDTQADVIYSPVHLYREEIAALAIDASKRVSVHFREMLTSTFVMDLADLPNAKQQMREFLDEFISRYEKKQGDSVFQVQLQLFPLTNVPDTERRSL